MYAMMWLYMMLFTVLLFFSNLLVLWTCLLILTVGFMSLVSLTSSVNYFLIQEISGLLFLLFTGSLLQVLFILIKVGVSPLHFWVFSVVSSLDSYMVMWLLTFQKMPVVPVLMHLLDFLFLILIVFGLLVCYLQMLGLYNYKFLLTVSSTESFSWILLGLLFGALSFIMIFVYYFFVMINLIQYIHSNSLSYMSLELTLVFMNIPLSVTFIIKIMMLNLGFMVFDYLLLMVLFLMFMSTLGLMVWLMTFTMLSSKIFKESWHYCLVYYLTILMLQ